MMVVGRLGLSFVMRLTTSPIVPRGFDIATLHTYKLPIQTNLVTTQVFPTEGAEAKVGLWLDTLRNSAFLQFEYFIENVNTSAP